LRASTRSRTSSPFTVSAISWKRSLMAAPP
jgi:hypothetical protein